MLIKSIALFQINLLVDLKGVCYHIIGSIFVKELLVNFEAHGTPIKVLKKKSYFFVNLKLHAQLSKNSQHHVTILLRGLYGTFKGSRPKHY